MRELSFSKILPGALSSNGVDLQLPAAHWAALRADLINILEEKQPDYWSGCSRIKAEFVRYKDRDKVKKLYSDVSYQPEYIIRRSVEASDAAKARLRATVIGAALGVFPVG